MMNCVYFKPLLILLLHQITTNGDEICQEAIDDIKVVAACPTSKKDRDEAALKMKCNEFAKLKNCTKEQLEYHCVINTFMNETLEVCAPARYIFGHCTEFNIAGRVIQRHDAAICNDVFPKCDAIYSSKDAYKYPDCYNLVYEATQNTTVFPLVNKTCNNKTEHGDKKREEIVYVYIASIFGLVVILILTVVLYVRVAVWRVNRKGYSTKEQDELNSIQGKRNLSGEAHNHIWEAVPLLCFQNNLSLNSALETLRTESACHKILIKSKEAICNETDEAGGSTVIIGQNKESIIKTITSCLIQPICQMEKKWLKYLEAEYSIILTSAILEDLKVVVKKVTLENSKETVV